MYFIRRPPYPEPPLTTLCLITLCLNHCRPCLTTLRLISPAQVLPLCNHLRILELDGGNGRPSITDAGSTHCKTALPTPDDSAAL